MTEQEIADFVRDVQKRAETFELAGETKPRAHQKALAYKLRELSPLSASTVETLQKAVSGRFD